MSSREPIHLRHFVVASATIAGLCTAIATAIAQVDTKVAADTVRRVESSRGEPRKLNYAKAKARPLPQNKRYSEAALKKDLVAALEKNGELDTNLNVRRSNPGDGKRAPGNPKVPKKVGAKTKLPEDFGAANLPYSTARADLDPMPTNTQWPYRAAGKLTYLDGEQSYMCSAALIDRGLVVTAAHCVSEFGANRMFSDFEFIPGFRDGDAPFGIWKVSKVYVLSGYPAGTAPCDEGVVCRDDIALMVLVPKKDAKTNKPYFAGQRTGWFAYASGPVPFTQTGLTHVTQLGYPGCLDDGNRMARNDAQAATSATYRNNSVFGSLMCGGSSGGPWIANFGIKPELTDTIDGIFAHTNVVIGVTSWGATDQRVKQQGASPFLESNIDFLVRAACKDFPGACTN